MRDSSGWRLPKAVLVLQEKVVFNCRKKDHLEKKKTTYEKGLRRENAGAVVPEGINFR